MTLLRRFRAAHAAAAPASTLLIATLLTLALATFARFAAATALAVPSTVHVSPRAAPGGTIEVAVEAPAGERIVAELPGLATPTPLRYDPRTGFHLATLALPADAPERGWCTVRIVFDDRVEHDLRVELIPPDLEPPTERTAAR